MSVSERMRQIQSAFLAAKEFALIANQSEQLSDFLSAKSGDFSSVSFEGAAMGLAIRSYNKTKTLSEWNWFIEKYSAVHTSQIYVGLGWAIAELGIDPTPIVSDLNSASRYRVMDGIGYYHGILRRRAAVERQLIPDIVPTSLLPAYDQGLGRSLWYNSGGEIERVLQKIALFPKDRTPAFWRGLGVAITYVGGTPDKQIEAIRGASKSNLAHLKYGALMALLSRKKAGTSCEDSSVIVRCLVPNFNEIGGRVEQLENEIDTNYLKTIETIESLL